MADAPEVSSALDRRQMRAAFGHAADAYDAAAVLQREVADRLVERLDLLRLQPVRILDLGCGTGYVTRAVAARYPGARVAALDIALGMLRHARARRHGRVWPWRRERRDFVCADAERLPFAAASFDMVLSNLTLQWCQPDVVFAEVGHVLRPGGVWMFSTFGPDTLTELRTAWRAADAGAHVHDFVDMHDLGDALVRAGFADPVMDVERLTLTYADVLGLLRDLKQLGAHNVARARARGLTGKRQFARFRAAYEAQARDGRIPATYEIVHGQAWAPAGGAFRHRSSEGGAAAIPVDRIARRR